MAGTVITIGNFDGVHLGHRKVLLTLISIARTFELEPVVITFKGHPRYLKVKPGTRFLLTTPEEKISLIRETGIERVEVLEFNERIMNMSVEEFLDFLIREYNMKHLVMGFNHHFARNREGNPQRVPRFLERYKFFLTVVPPEYLGDKLISSTLIRELIKEGRVEEAQKALGRYYTIQGKVTRGKRIAGELGYRTVNLEIHQNKLLPGNGVYAVKVMLEESEYKGVAYIGESPTLALGEHRVEVHIFDFEEEVYGKEVIVNFVKYIREERKFDSIDTLKRQIQQDIEKASSILSL